MRPRSWEPDCRDVTHQTRRYNCHLLVHDILTRHLHRWLGDMPVVPVKLLEGHTSTPRVIQGQCADVPSKSEANCEDTRANVTSQTSRLGVRPLQGQWRTKDQSAHGSDPRT